MTSTVIKQSAVAKIQTQVERESTFLVKSKTPFISAIKRIDVILDKFDRDSIDHKKFRRGNYKKIKYIRVKGMGKAIEKVASLAAHYTTKKAYKVDVYTGTVDVVDEVQHKTNHSLKDDDSDTESEYRERKVSYMEIKIWLKRDS
ncbi:putative ribonucleases P/MRP protein subunit [Clavispora lusitaniae]|uniref:Ribonuclease P/MRP protein subunit n=2 Tax=Clavispora lusitaniae TaxID=36911 RepID=A0AA91SZW4_CLALS|nr:hypothetical protein E0198_001547 [Clavispora lusitaniae]KAF7583391.1 Rpp20 subunit of nuclear RNase MRP and P family protein [Clavispora lusitaniae]OVF06264.1 putative ribonuclease P/MRP protein subunit [Clavispora lusitaniae]QFZ26653.1 putative ribonucleases P/MRP protein subunit [Clavispora lusitaniae]QFZ32321.1 putative ribonucleases P/MRP protein subunit [Clavispora lusitaniae]